MARVPKKTIDTLVLVVGDPNTGKSSQIRSIFHEPELSIHFDEYPTSQQVAKRYYVHPDMDLYVKLASWHERNETYQDVKKDISLGYREGRHRYKIIAASQASGTDQLPGAVGLIKKLDRDFDIRRGFLVWLDPNVKGTGGFKINSELSAFLKSRPYMSALSIDSAALKPREDPSKNCINARFLCDLLFRV